MVVVRRFADVRRLLDASDPAAALLMVSYDTHGDVLAIKVHKPNSLEHLRPTRFQRPKTAKPKTMHPILPPGILSCVFGELGSHRRRCNNGFQLWT